MIKQFVDKYRFLSNFYTCDLYDYKNTTVEHIFQASKAERTIDFLSVVNSQTPAEAKKLGRKIEIRSDWNEIKVSVMEKLLREKFSKKNPGLVELLLETGDEELQEGNYWNDTFWGVDLKTGIGENNLGKLLMKIRNDIRSC